MAGIPDVSLLDNTDERTPMVLVLDCSGSMADDNKIGSLNSGLQVLAEIIKNDPITSTKGRILVIEFSGDDNVRQGTWGDAMDFIAPTLTADGRTPTGAAITAALASIEAQKAELKANNVPYKRPILMLMSDGIATDNWEVAADACKAAEAANKVTVFSIGVGEGADMAQLSRYSAKGALRLDPSKFKELFVWLSASVKAVSQTAKGGSAQLPSTGSWASTGPV
jgi:uncharacterized protein YegL